MATESKGFLRCSFCGKPEYKVARLLYGNSAYICNECVALCYGMLVEDGLFSNSSDVNAKVDCISEESVMNSFSPFVP